LKSKLAFAFVAGVSAWAGLMSGSHALVLGDLRGSVLVGRALDVSVLVQAAPGEEVSAACFNAQVFHADTLQPSAVVAVRPVANATDGAYRIRVQSAKAVDEPVVTVELRSTCGASLTRRYVVLADCPVVAMPEPQAAVAVVSTAVPLPEAPQGAPSAEAGGQKTAPTVASQLAATLPAPVARRPTKRARPAVPQKSRPKPTVSPPVSKATAVGSVAETGKSELKLEALNLSAGQPDGLGSTTLSVPSPETVLLTSQVAALQEELKQIRVQSAKANADLAQLQVLLQRAQSERISLPLFYGVVAVLLMCVAVLSWLLWQRYREQPLTTEQPDVLGHLKTTVMSTTAVARPAEVAAPRTARDQAPLPNRPAQGRRDLERDTVIATHIESASGVGQTVLHPPTELIDGMASTTRLRDTGASDFSGLRSDEVDLDLDLSSWDSLAESVEPTSGVAESSLDVRQQAEFFVSLGQSERALAVLRKHIAEGRQPDPAVYLDLLSLFHSLGYKADFREYRAAFNRHFNCVMPDFPAFHLEGLDLMSYGPELEHLTRAWHQQDATAYLSSCIYRSEQVSAQASFELAAFRDLLLLLSIAEQLNEAQA